MVKPLPVIPPACPRCDAACLLEMSTPAVGSGVIIERHYCASCGWDPDVDGCPKCSGALVYDGNGRLVHKHKMRPWSRCDGLRRRSGIGGSGSRGDDR